MSQQILVAIIAGLAAALLYGSVLTGSPLAVLLFYASSIPLFVAGLGWSWVSAAIGAFAGTIVLGMLSGIVHAAAFGLAIAAPAAYLSRLAMLSRAGTQPGSVEWYPAGRLVLSTASIGAVVVTLSLGTFGFSLQRMHAGLREAFDQMISVNQGLPGLPDASQVDTDALAALFVRLMPPMSAVIWIAVSLASFYLAGRILRASNMLRRPWPDLNMIELPRSAALGVAVAIAISFIPGIVGLIASAAAAALLFAYLLVGLSIVHVATRNAPMRALILAAVYIVLFFGWSRYFVSWPAMLLAVLGLLESKLQLRERMLARSNKPPGAPPNSPRPPGG